MGLDFLQGTVSKNADAKKSPGTFYGTHGPPMLANHHESIWSHFAMSQLHYILLIILTCSEYSRLIGFTSQISPRSRNH